jgi:hypothetical protein
MGHRRLYGSQRDYPTLANYGLEWGTRTLAKNYSGNSLLVVAGLFLANQREKFAARIEIAESAQHG